MIKLAIMGLLFLCPFTNTDLTQFLDNFVESRECSKISLSGNLFSFKNKDNVKSEIEDFQLFIFDDGDLLSDRDVRAIKNEVHKNRMELLNMVKSKGSMIEIYVNESDDIIHELFMIVQGDDSSILFNANGKIRYEDLKNFNIDFDGSDELKKL